jgi:hypothetical protein
MSQYRSTGGLDDSIGEDVDRGFSGVNQRLQLNQLQETEVRESLNGRMEGYWRPRKGVVEKTSALTTGGTPLQLPFYLVGTSVRITAASVTSGVVTLTTQTSHGLTNGSTLNIQGIGYTAGSDPNGVFTATTASGTTITYPLAGGVGPYTVDAGTPSLSRVITATTKAITAASYAANVVTITITDHGFEAGSSGYAVVSGLTFTGTDANGSVVLTYVDANTMSFPVTGVTAVSGTGTLSQMPINDAANANVRASCLFSDPNTGNKEYVIVALDTVAKKIDLATYVATDIPYPIGQALGADTEMIQVFDKVMLFRDGQQALEWYPNGRAILSASQSGTTVTMNVREHGLLAGASVTIAGLTGGTPANGTFTVLASPAPTQDTFAYTFTTSQTQTFGVSAATMTDGFTLSPGGAYTQPQTFNIQAKDVDVVSGLVTATVTGNVTVRAGDIIVVRESATSELSGMVGNEYYVTEATTTTIKWYAPIGDYNTSSSDSFEFGGRFSVGGGFMHQPGAPWGVYFQRRLWVPHYYNQSGAYNAPTYTSTKITDEIAVSDILDTTTFDQIENQFRISGGTADYVVGMHGFYDDALVVLNRNSLHVIQGTQGSLLDTQVKELTSEVGCLARKSVVMRGNTMMFLSDDGVYAVEFLNDYNLRGADEPISKNIQPYIDRINKDYADRAVGVLFDNRYYLAVPLDSVAGANDARGNNSILVFNFLNKGWESLDTYGDSRFLIKNFVIGSAGVRNDIYAVTGNGGLHQIDAVDSSVDRLNVSNVGSLLVTPTINASLTTRGYDLGTMERKRFTDAQIVMQNLAGETGEYMISFASEDPDNASEIGTTTQFLGGEVLAPSSPNEAETAGIRCRLGGIRGYTGTMILTRTQGSPKINSVKVAGSVTNRQILSQK